MKKLNSRFMIAAAFCAVMISVSCTKEDIIPVSTNMYNRLLPIWEQRESPRWHNTVEKYASHYGYTVIKDTVHVGSGNRTVTYLCQTDTLIYLLETWAINDTLWSLDCYLFAPTERWLKDQMVIFENEMYNRHPEGYTGGSFYWYTSPGNVRVGMGRGTHPLWSPSALSGRRPAQTGLWRHPIQTRPIGSRCGTPNPPNPSHRVPHLRYHRLEQSLLVRLRDWLYWWVSNKLWWVSNKLWK